MITPSQALYLFQTGSDCSTVIEGEAAGYRADSDFIKKIRGNADEAVEIEEYLSLNVLFYLPPLQRRFPLIFIIHIN